MTHRFLPFSHSIEVSPAWGGAAPTITPLPPDQGGGANTLGLYLYHIAEDPRERRDRAAEERDLVSTLAAQLPPLRRGDLRDGERLSIDDEEELRALGYAQ